jgi:uncharacterized coiled-coil protein SlyX
MDNRIDQLEIKIAYLEQANAELSDELIKQRLALDALRDQLTTLSGRLAAQAEATTYSADEEKPPHY